ncbi:hypothetical protein A3L21_20040 [Pantoea agglomerans]|nr:hypothetical protein A3L21_20040 [Pantoea agglomerans]
MPFRTYYILQKVITAWIFQKLMMSCSGALSYVMKVAYLQVVVLCYFMKMAQLRLRGFIFDRNIGVGSSENR